MALSIDTILASEWAEENTVTKTIAASGTTEVLFSELTDTPSSNPDVKIISSAGDSLLLGYKVDTANSKIIITNNAPVAYTDAKITVVR